MPHTNRAAFDGKIPLRERDLQLKLGHPEWPREGCRLGGKDETPAPGAEPWQRLDGYLYRTISPKRQPLWEAMLRFPNAPVYGLHQRPGRQAPIDDRSNFHTMRVLGLLEDDDEQALPRHPIEDVYILHNGLNETSDFDLHYQLASRLLKQSEGRAVCIVRPFPAHLTRYPYSDMFAERPLDTFLLDSGDLFRQFVRFMLETRWLLSILVPRSSYNVITGGKLVPCQHWEESCELASSIVGEWDAMDQAEPDDPRRARRGAPDVTVSAVTRTIEVLRDDLLQWGPVHGGRIPDAGKEEAPAVHMVGYSLGGFLAQSAFFAWPYAISGCITLFGGGELRKLAPTAFAQPEEWQSVLHSLRYELDRAMGGPLRPQNGKVQGIDQEAFEYLRRVFYEVFLQYYQGSYRTRLAEFIQRMLFVTGGQDPIVRPDNILDAAPPEGVNLINIAGMSHFPMKPKERVQKEQRDFWLEQLGQIVPAFAEQADDRRLDVLHRSWLNDQGTALHELAEEAYQGYKKQLDDVGEPPSEARQGSGASLSDRWFGIEIGRICDFIAAGSNGWVLVSRNEIPPVFQTEEVLKRYAAGLHHSEDLAADEFWLASQRREALLEGRARVTLLVTDIALETGFEQVPSLFPPRSETPGVARLSDRQRLAAREYFERNWERPEPAAVRVVSTGEFLPGELGDIGAVVGELQELDREDPATRISVRFLPDAWIGISERLLETIQAAVDGECGAADRAGAETAILAWGTGLAEERTAEARQRRKALEAKDDDERLAAAFPNESRLGKALKSRDISIVEFSRAGLNPRYRGQRVTSPKRGGEVLIHWALAYKAAGLDRDEKPPLV
jgi:pimeloyl-ACP methyl ester carboxylesterase